MRSPILVPVALLVAVALLYGGFLWNPLVFDDVYVFLDGTLIRYGNGDFSFAPRWLSLYTLGLSRHVFGLDLIGFRLPSLLLHAGVSMALYGFLLQLWRAMLPVQEADRLSYSAMAFFAALIFALHPVAVYGAGYLIQRSTVMATLFALLMWWAFLRGLERERVAWLWGSAIFYGLALSSKEHVVMAPAVSAILLLLWWRTHGKTRADASRESLRLIPVFLGYGAMALFVVLQVKGYLGRVYEILGPDTVGQLSEPQLNEGLIYFLSVFNQGALFFKYLGLWILPNPMWMSVDMREPFVTSFWVWPQIFGFATFLMYPIISLLLVWRGGRLGVLGFALIAPWLLFATEISTVRIQEQFVLYRSYLWAAPAFAGMVLLFGAMKKRHAIFALGLFSLIMYPLAYQRLQTFSHPLLVWDDAVRLVEGKNNLTGLARIYFNRGHEFQNIKHYEDAIADYTRALEERSAYTQPFIFGERGAAYLALKRHPEALQDFEAAISLKQDDPRTYMGRGLALEAVNQPDSALASFRTACQLGWKAACDKLK